MVKVKMMTQSVFDKLSNDFTVFSELVKTRQDEKQSLLNEFDLELKRYKQGKISENALANSVKKKNKELVKLDGNIKTAISKGLALSEKMVVFVKAQAPIRYVVKETGISGGVSKKKKKSIVKKKSPVKKKVSKKKVKMTKAEIAKEMKLEKKLMK